MPLSPIEVLRKVPLFSGLSETDLAAFADLTRERSYPKGSVIVFEDDPGDALFLVAAGQVKVVLIAEDGREVILSVLGEGSFFGEMAVIDEEPRSAHVIAMEDSGLLVLRREDFYARLRSSPEVAISLLREISLRSEIATSGEWRSRAWKSSRRSTSRLESSMAITCADLGSSSITAISPKKLPSPSTDRMTSRPSSAIRTTLTWPAATRKSASPGSSSKTITLPLG